MKLLETISLEVNLFVVQWTRMADNEVYCRITLAPESPWSTAFVGKATCGKKQVFNQRYAMWLSLKRCLALNRLNEPLVYNYTYRSYIWQRFKQFVQMKGLYLHNKPSQSWPKVHESKMPGVTYQYDGDQYMVKEIALWKGTKKDPKKWKKVVIYTCFKSHFMQTYVRDFSTFTSKYMPCPPKDQKKPS